MNTTAHISLSRTPRQTSRFLPCPTVPDDLFEFFTAACLPAVVEVELLLGVRADPAGFDVAVFDVAVFDVADCGDFDLTARLSIAFVTKSTALVGVADVRRRCGLAWLDVVVVCGTFIVVASLIPPFWVPLPGADGRLVSPPGSLVRLFDVCPGVAEVRFLLLVDTLLCCVWELPPPVFPSPKNDCHTGPINSAVVPLFPCPAYGCPPGPPPPVPGPGGGG